MKKARNLVVISAILGSCASQAATIGAVAQGGLFGSDYIVGGIETNYAYVEGNQSTAPILEPSLGNYSYRAEATFDINALTPQLRVLAVSDNISDIGDPFIAAEAYAFQTYQNTSSSSQTFTINLSLHGVVTNSPTSRLLSDIGIYAGTSMSSNASDCVGGYGGYLSGFNTFMCGDNIGETRLRIDSGTQTVLDTLSFTIAAGETFTTYSTLEALTVGGSVNALNTLNINFDDTTNLKALGEMPSPVPVPAAVWLFGSGLLGLIGVTRRKTRA